MDWGWVQVPPRMSCNILLINKCMLTEVVGDRRSGRSHRDYGIINPQTFHHVLLKGYYDYILLQTRGTHTFGLQTAFVMTMLLHCAVLLFADCFWFNHKNVLCIAYMFSYFSASFNANGTCNKCSLFAALETRLSVLKARPHTMEEKLDRALRLVHPLKNQFW